MTHVLAIALHSKLRGIRPAEIEQAKTAAHYERELADNELGGDEGSVRDRVRGDQKQATHQSLHNISYQTLSKYL